MDTQWWQGEGVCACAGGLLLRFERLEGKNKRNNGRGGGRWEMRKREERSERVLYMLMFRQAKLGLKTV